MPQRIKPPTRAPACPPDDPGELRGSPKVAEQTSQSWSTFSSETESTQISTFPAVLGQVGNMWAELRPNLAKFGGHWPKLAKCWPTLTQSWPSLANAGRKLQEFGKCWPHCDRHVRYLFERVRLWQTLAQQERNLAESRLATAGQQQPLDNFGARRDHNAQGRRSCVRMQVRTTLPSKFLKLAPTHRCPTPAHWLCKTKWPPTPLPTTPSPPGAPPTSPGKAGGTKPSLLGSTHSSPSSWQVTGQPHRLHATASKPPLASRWVAM